MKCKKEDMRGVRAGARARAGGEGEGRGQGAMMWMMRRKLRP